LGVYLSPTDQINEDIAEQFGGLSIDDFIGAYSDLYENHYKDLDGLSREYFKKYTSKNNPQAFIRLLRYFDASFFTMIKQLTPYRANLQTGLVIEPHILDRSKIKLAGLPTMEDLSYETLIQLPSTSEPTGSILDIDPGSIDAGVATTIGGSDIPVHEGQVNGAYMVDVTAPWNVKSIFTRNSLLYKSGSIPGSYPNDTLKSYITSYGKDKVEGSQYSFYSWYSTGSGTYTGIVSNSAGFAYVNSIGSDYSNPIGTQVYSSTPSEVLTGFVVEGVSYSGTDIYDGSGSFLRAASFPLNTNYVDEAIRDTTNTVGKFGLRVQTESESLQQHYNVSHSWLLSSADYLGYNVIAGTFATGSAWIRAFAINQPRFQQKPNYYNVTFDIKAQSNLVGTTASIWFGSSGSSTEPDVIVNARTTTTNVNQLVINPTNSDIYVEWRTTSASAQQISQIDNLVVRPYIFTQVQDYQVGPLASIGQRNQKYNGCKLVATDWNVDSSDTIDRGPVVTIVEGPGTDITVDPNSGGTFTFR
jgi:hypothetical protein